MELQSVLKARYDQIYDRVANYKDMFPQHSKLRIELPLQNGVGRYEYDLKEAIVNNLTTFCLSRNDVVIPNGAAVLLGIAHKQAGKADVERIFSFPQICDGTRASVSEVGFKNKDIFNLYNGYVQWLVGSTVAWENQPMEDFLKIPRQQGAAVLDSSDAPVIEAIEPEFDIEKMIQLIMAKYFVCGTEDHKLTVNFPATGLDFGLAAADGTPITDGSYEARLILYFDVILVKNGTKLFNTTGDGPFKEASGRWE